MLWVPSGFRPLAGLSCINPFWDAEQAKNVSVVFPSPRGVELHKPLLTSTIKCA